MRPALGAAVLVLGTAASAFSQQYLTPDEALRIAFPEPARIEKKLVAATNEQRARIAETAKLQEVERFYEHYEGRTPEGALLGYAVIGDVIGKHQPITYMIAFAPDHAVRAIEILVYRESYGYEVRRESFRRQFYGKGPEAPIRLNAEIRNITGATISCRSIIRAVTIERAYVSTLLPRFEASTPDPAPEKASALDPGEGAYRRRARVLMGAVLDIQAYGSDAAIDAAFTEVARIEGLLSDWREDTPVARLNRSGAAAVGVETAALLARSKALSAESLGAFDVTARPLVALWRAAEARGALPSPAEIDAARGLVGAEGLRLSEEGAALASAGMSVDLGGVGKGYALDRAAAALRARGVASALLNFGGQLLALGPPPGRKGWPVDVRDPRGAGRALASFDLARGSAATSADDERGLRIAGRRYSHVVDARTGRPAEGLLSATVLAESAERADAWSTALYALGEDADRLARARGLSALLLAPDGELRRVGWEERP